MLIDMSYDVTSVCQDLVKLLSGGYCCEGPN